jgi:putative ABC transport system permease protein
VLGVWLAGRGVGMLRAVATRVSPRASEIALDPVVFLFALGVSVAVALTVAALPLLRRHRSANIADALRAGNAGSTIGRGEGRLRSALVAAQVAIAFVLLIGAGLIGKSLLELERVQTGFESSGVLTARLNLNFSKYNTFAARRNFTDALLERLSGTPAVSSVAVASALPLSDAEPANISFQIAGISSAGDARGPHADVTAVSPDYFRTVGIPLLRGRQFSATDRDTLTPVVIVSRRLARTYWEGRDPIGTRITADSGRHWFTVVGVVGDVRQTRLDQDITDELYLTVANETPGDLRVFLRTSGATGGPAPAVVSRLREVVRALDDKQPIVSIQTLDQVRGVQLEEPRLTTVLLASFAALALILTATGLGGIVAYAVSQRLPEIAVRLALGANHASVLRLVVRDGVGSVAIGLVVGGALALATSRFASALLYQVAPTDAVTYLAVAAMLLMTAVAACLLPARRALRVDPARVLRDATP